MLACIKWTAFLLTIISFHAAQEHGKDYGDSNEELMRHTVWESNKKYIDTHNDNADTLGYTLAMNEYGDLVWSIVLVIHYY